MATILDSAVLHKRLIYLSLEIEKFKIYSIRLNKECYVSLTAILNYLKMCI